ncbi:hypothetical protein [Pontibacter silvestris]
MSRKTIYQAVLSTEPFLVSEFIDFEKASRTDCSFIIKKLFSHTHTTYSDNKYEIYNYSILNKDQEVVSVENNEWKIEEVYDGYFGKQTRQNGNNTFIRWSAWNNYLISDPNGELRRIMFVNPKEALEHLSILSQFQSWADYEIENRQVML